VAPQTLYRSDDASFLVVVTASFEPTWVLAAHSAAQNMEGEAASSVHQKVKYQSL
jgi:hypothetical protein